MAIDAGRRVPGDWRPLNLAGSAWLFAGRPERAVEIYRRALALGERPELDVNLARAYAALGRPDAARTALLRAAWISPAILEGFPAATQAALKPELEALERRLVGGTLVAPAPASSSGSSRPCRCGRSPRAGRRSGPTCIAARRDAGRSPRAPGRDDRR